jgi:hypothetical protein
MLRRSNDLDRMAREVVKEAELIASDAANGIDLEFRHQASEYEQEVNTGFKIGAIAVGAAIVGSVFIKTGGDYELVEQLRLAAGGMISAPAGAAGFYSVVSVLDAKWNLHKLNKRRKDSELGTWHS